MKYNTERIARMITKLTNKDFDKEMKLEFTDSEIMSWCYDKYNNIPTIRISNNINAKSNYNNDLTFITALLGEENKVVGQYVFNILATLGDMYKDIILYTKENEKYINLINNIIELASTADAKLENELNLRRLHSYVYAIFEFKTIYDILIEAGLVPNYNYTKVPQRKEIDYNYNFICHKSSKYKDPTIELTFIKEYTGLLPEDKKDEVKEACDKYVCKIICLLHTGVYKNIYYLAKYMDESYKRRNLDYIGAYMISIFYPALIKYCCGVLSENPQANLTENI